MEHLQTKKSRRRKLVGSVIVGAIIASAAGIAYFSNNDSGSGAATADVVNIAVDSSDFEGRLLPVVVADPTAPSSFAGRENASVHGSYTVTNPNRTPLALFRTAFDYSDVAVWGAEDIYVVECFGATISDADCTVSEIDDVNAADFDLDTVVAKNDTVTKDVYLFLADSGVSQDQLQDATLTFDFTIEGRTVGDIDNTNTDPFAGGDPTEEPTDPAAQNPDDSIGVANLPLPITGDGATALISTSTPGEIVPGETVVSGVAYGRDLDGNWGLLVGQPVQLKFGIFDNEGVYRNEAAPILLTTDENGAFSHETSAADGFGEGELVQIQLDMKFSNGVHQDSASEGGSALFLPKDLLLTAGGDMADILALADILDDDQFSGNRTGLIYNAMAAIDQDAADQFADFMSENGGDFDGQARTFVGVRPAVG